MTYWPAPNAQEVEFADSLVREWNARHPDIHVVMQSIPVNQSTEEVLLAAIAGKTTPDVCSNINPIALRDYVASGGLVPLDQFPDFDSVVTREYRVIFWGCSGLRTVTSTRCRGRPIRS